MSLGNGPNFNFAGISNHVMNDSASDGTPRYETKGVAMYDLIGDIHGHYDKLIALLEKLGYQDVDGIWRHPEGRQPFFLG